MNYRKRHIMSNKVSTGTISDKALKGAATDALIGARFGPQGIAIGAIARGVIGFLLESNE